MADWIEMGKVGASAVEKELGESGSASGLDFLRVLTGDDQVAAAIKRLSEGSLASRETEKSLAEAAVRPEAEPSVQGTLNVESRQIPKEQPWEHPLRSKIARGYDPWLEGI